jgi:hypothetical protein
MTNDEKIIEMLESIKRDTEWIQSRVALWTYHMAFMKKYPNYDIEKIEAYMQQKEEFHIDEVAEQLFGENKLVVATKKKATT